MGVVFTEEYLDGKVAGTLEEESSAGGQLGTEARVVSAVFRVAVTPPACSGKNSWNQALNSLSPVSGLSGTKPWQATKIFENKPNVISCYPIDVPAMQIMNMSLMVPCAPPTDPDTRLVF